MCIRDSHRSELGIGTVGEAHDALALFESSHVAAEVDNFASEVAAEDSGKLDGHASAGCAAAEFPVDGIDAGGPDAHADLVRPEGRFLLIGFVLKLVDIAVFVQNNRFHREISSGGGMRGAANGSLGFPSVSEENYTPTAIPLGFFESR